MFFLIATSSKSSSRTQKKHSTRFSPLLSVAFLSMNVFHPGFSLQISTSSFCLLVLHPSRVISPPFRLIAPYRRDGYSNSSIKLCSSASLLCPTLLFILGRRRLLLSNLTSRGFPLFSHSMCLTPQVVLAPTLRNLPPPRQDSTLVSPFVLWTFLKKSVSPFRLACPTTTAPSSFCEKPELPQILSRERNPAIY